MPYIKPEARNKWPEVFDKVLELTNELPEDKKEGELNYFISSILNRTYPTNYYNLNKVIGLLECIKQEFYRKVIGPYEEIKIKENGEI